MSSMYALSGTLLVIMALFNQFGHLRKYKTKIVVTSLFIPFGSTTYIVLTYADRLSF